MNDIDNARVASAISQQGSSSYATTSGAILTLLTDFAREGKLAAMAEAFTRFRAVFGANAAFVQEAIPAKILNWVFAMDGALDFKTFEKWSKSPERQAWKDQLKETIANPAAFETLVKNMQDELLSLSNKTAA